MPSSTSWFITVCCRFDLVSTVGDSPVTVIVSLTLPTSSFALTRRDERRADRDVGALDGAEALQLELDVDRRRAAADRSDTLPDASVVCVCTPPISLSPDSDTVTPGITALLVSVTTPAIGAGLDLRVRGRRCQHAEHAEHGASNQIHASSLSLSGNCVPRIVKQCRGDDPGAKECESSSLNQDSWRSDFTIARILVDAMKRGLILVANRDARLSRSFAVGQSNPANSPAPDPQTALVTRSTCAGCHSERGKAGGLSLAAFDADRGRQHADGRREDDPQAARGHDAAARRAAP